MAFKLGARPGVIPTGLHDLTFYAAGSLPKAPASVPVPAVASWGMDGNSTAGTCGVAGINHYFMADASIAGVESESFPGDQEILDYYFTYTGGQDTGVVLSDFLAYVKTHPFFGHTVDAYAPVGVHDIPTMQFVIDAYGAAYTGITVTQAMMSAVQSSPSGWVWTTQDTQGEPVGGHCIPVVGYDDQFLTAVSWGQAIQISYPAWHRMSTEAWAVLSGEFAAKGGDTRGIDLAALQADLAKVSRQG